jgi:hypothetical protein
VVSPVSVEAPSSYEFPLFEWERPESNSPYILRKRGRAVLKTAQGLAARPFEFKYTASFQPTSAEQPVAVIGQRTLILEGIDLAQHPLTGYRAMDMKLIDIRNRLRKSPGVTAADLDDALQILIALSSLAARAVHDRLFKNVASEGAFQTYLRDDLRRTPRLAAALEEHPHATGGITDLSFHGLPIELKYEDRQAVALADCQAYLAQAASYAVGRGKRIAILCVLDNVEKNATPAPPEEGLELLHVTSGNSQVWIPTIILQGGLARPSDLSR